MGIELESFTVDVLNVFRVFDRVFPVDSGIAIDPLSVSPARVSIGGGP